MVVNNLLTEKDKLVIVSPKDTVEKALKLIEDSDLLSIPVCEESKFLGSVSKERIYKFYYEKNIEKKVLLQDFKVQDVMKTNIPTLSYLDGVENAAEYLANKKIPFVAVNDQYGKFKGIITHKAIFNEFTEVFGLNKGNRLSVVAYDVPGQISKLSRIITENGGDIISFVVVDPKAPIDVREIGVRIRTDNMAEIAKKVGDAGFQIQS